MLFCVYMLCLYRSANCILKKHAVAILYSSLILNRFKHFINFLLGIFIIYLKRERELYKFIMKAII